MMWFGVKYNGKYYGFIKNNKKHDLEIDKTKFSSEILYF